MFGAPKCPVCSGQVEAKTESTANFIARMLGAEVLAYVFAGVLFAIGILWWPALVIGGIFALWLLFFRDGSGVEYECKSCGKRMQHEDLYRAKSYPPSNP